MTESRKYDPMGRHRPEPGFTVVSRIVHDGSDHAFAVLSVSVTCCGQTANQIIVKIIAPEPYRGLTSVREVGHRTATHDSA